MVERIKVTPPNPAAIRPATGSLAEALQNAPEDPDFDLETWTRQWAAIEAEMKPLIEPATLPKDAVDGRLSATMIERPGPAVGVDLGQEEDRGGRKKPDSLRKGGLVGSSGQCVQRSEEVGVGGIAASGVQLPPDKQTTKVRSR
ncbi:MAG: hypothetical protein AB1649_12095 [Chloroflexota bacterium]